MCPQPSSSLGKVCGIAQGWQGRERASARLWCPALWPHAILCPLVPPVMHIAGPGCAWVLLWCGGMGSEVIVLEHAQQLLVNLLYTLAGRHLELYDARDQSEGEYKQQVCGTAIRSCLACSEPDL